MSEPVPLVTAVLSALAGVRVGQSVLVLGRATTLRKAIEAGTGVPLVVTGPADVAIALTGPDLPEAVLQTRPGGRVVALAADAGAVERTVALHRLQLTHSEPVAGRVAWSAQKPA